MNTCDSSLGRITALVAALAILAVGGCGGGSGSGGQPVTLCPTDAFTPNYANNVARLIDWGSFPVTVYFVQDINYTPQLQNLATAAFSRWVTATGGAITYQLVNNIDSSDVQVRFDPATQNGLTNLTFTEYTMANVDMHIGIRLVPAADIGCIAAHEFGHALGIDGHSDASGDLMYSIHVIGSPCDITIRDLSTLKTGYCHVFGRSPASHRVRPAGPAETVTIH